MIPEVVVISEANISNEPEVATPLAEVNMSPIKIDISDTEVDPGLWKLISEISRNEKDRIRRAYLLKGPF